MPNIGLPELVVIGMILVLVFGASRLPQLGAGMGRAVRNLKRAFDHEPRIGVTAEKSPPDSAKTPVEDSPGLKASRHMQSDVSDAELVSAEAEKRDKVPPA